MQVVTENKRLELGLCAVVTEPRRLGNGKLCSLRAVYHIWLNHDDRFGLCKKHKVEILDEHFNAVYLIHELIYTCRLRYAYWDAEANECKLFDVKEKLNAEVANLTKR